MDWHLIRRDLTQSGVATLKGFFAQQDVEVMCSWMRTVLERGRDIPRSFEPEFEPGTDAVRKLRRLYWNDEVFWSKVFAEADLPGVAQRFFGTQVALTFHASFLKPPKVGTQVALHQDQALWNYSYSNAISIWVALTPAKLSNGCLIGCPGSHLGGVVPHVQIPDHAWHEGVDWRAAGLSEPVPYELEAGDALIWDRHFVHGSGPNRSADPRWGMVMVFIDRTQAGLRTTDRVDF